MGKTKITVTTEDGKKTANSDVTVTATSVPVTGVKLNKTTLTLVKGDSETLIPTIAPANATNQNVTWISSDASIASVDKVGKVTAIKEGSVNITVTTDDGGKKAVCAVTVVESNIPVVNVKLNKQTLNLLIGTSEALQAIIEPENATNKKVTWISTDASIASVDATGLVKGLKAGSVKITVTTDDGKKTATCNVNVTETTVAVTGVKLNKSTLSLVAGSSETLEAIIAPANATNQQVTWASDEPTIAAVNEKGVVTAIKPGNAKITVTTQDGGKTATCEVIVTSDVVPVNSVSLNKTTLSLIEGAGETLTATIAPANATNQNVSWSSSDPTVASVDSKGKVTAIKSGTSTIKVTTEDGGKNATCEVTVIQSSIAVTGVTINKATLNLLIGGSETLKAIITPENATNKNVTWVSSDASIASVDASGLVKGLKVGSAKITVTTEDGKKTASCDVTITESAVPVTGVKLNKSVLSLIAGANETLVATIAPANATNQNLKWSSGDPTIAAVDDNGKVMAIKSGNTIITVTTEDGGKTATCAVTVTSSAVSVTGVALNKSTLSLIEGSGETLTATITPANATNKNLKWSSSDATVATVDNTGKVSAIRVGNATITVTTEDGGKTATCAVTVTSSSIAVTGVTLNKSTLSLMDGAGETLTATITPANATNKNVKWSSSDPTVATVSTTGKVTGVKAGNATITVTTEDGGKTATCAVTVISSSIAVTGVTLNKSTLSLTEGNGETLTATIIPANATNKNVKWSSSDPTIATVSTNGTVIAVKAGNVTITVTTEDGGKTATCAVTVIKKIVPVTGVTLNKSTLSLTEGNGETLTATIIPANATNKNVKWSSSDPTVATVSTNGTVIAVKAGNVTITVTTEDGGKTATCAVTVIKKIVPVTGVSVSSSSLHHMFGTSFDPVIEATITPANATNKNVTWSSSDPTIVMMTVDGLKVTLKPLKVGQVSITVTTEDGGKQATSAIFIDTQITGITLNKSTLTIGKGDKFQFIATVLPENATYKKVSWRTSNPSIATISDTGELSPLAEGDVTITAVSPFGAKYAECKVKVVHILYPGYDGEDRWNK